MDIEKTPLFQEIKQIIDEGPKPVNYFYKFKIHAGDKEFETIKVVDLDFKKDYHNGYADEITVKAVIPLGLWAKVIYPVLHILDITVIKTPIKEVSDSTQPDEDIVAERFTAVPIGDYPVVSGKNIDNMSIQALDLQNIFTIEFQLIDKSIEKLRMVTFGGIFRRATPEDVIKGVLAKESGKIKTINGAAIKTVDMVPANNEEKREHFLIPHGTRIIDIPKYVQERCGGVYTCGINCYYQSKGWFVYPLYNVQRYNQAPKKMTIMKVPKQRYTGIERTYREDGNILYVIGTSDSNFDDSSYVNTLNQGDGLRFADSRRFLRDIVEKKDNKAIIERDKVNHEFVFSKKSDRPDNKRNQNVHLSSENINSNPFMQWSKLAYTNGSNYEFDWENSDPNILIPGMMVRILYMNKLEMKELNGVLLLAHNSVQLRGSGLTATRHITNTKLIIFANSIIKQDNEPQDESDEAAINNWLDYEST